MKKAAPATLFSVFTILIVFFALIFSAAAFGPQAASKQAAAKQATTKPATAKIPLLDRSTGQLIGYKDTRTGNLVIASKHRVILRSKIKRVSGKEFRRILQKYGCGKLSPAADNKLKMMSRPPREAEAAFDEMDAQLNRMEEENNRFSTGGGGGNEDGACVSLCWVMEEGGARCQGCCKDVGNGFCECWELCTDDMSSLAY